MYEFAPKTNSSQYPDTVATKTSQNTQFYSASNPRYTYNTEDGKLVFFFCIDSDVPYLTYANTEYEHYQNNRSVCKSIDFKKFAVVHCVVSENVAGTTLAY